VSGLVQASQLDREEWLAALGQTPGAPPTLHPDLLANGGGAGVVALRSGDARSLVLGLFEPATTPLLRIAGLGRFARVRTLRCLAGRLVGDGHPDGVARFVGALAGEVATGAATAALFETVEAGSPLWSALHSVTASSPVCLHQLAPPQPRWYLEFPAERAEYWNRFSSKSRKNLRRTAAQLDHEVRRVTGAADVPDLLEWMSAVSSRSWQGRRLGKRFRNDAATRRGLEALAGIGALRSYVLLHGGAPVAFVHGTQYGGCYAFEETAYDGALAAASPGRILCLRMIEDLLAERTPDRLDFGAGDAEYKRFFATRGVSCASLLLVRRSLSTRAGLWAARLAQRAEQATRGALQNTRAYRGLRNLYRR
jgi:CelD/BcsL family acetyltransferase involved in cellulose biosynthesis